MPTITSQLSELSAVGVRIPAFPATVLPAGLARYAAVVSLDKTGPKDDDAYQSRLERWCDELEELYLKHIAGRRSTPRPGEA